MIGILLLSLGALGSWFVHRANVVYTRITTCRYRELNFLERRADQYSVAYVVLGVLSGILLYPFGALITVWVFGYAAYRRFT